MKRYLWGVLISLDQLGNALLGGDPDETISSRMGKLVAKRKCKLCKLLCWVIDKIDPNHCVKTIEPDEGDKSPINS